MASPRSWCHGLVFSAAVAASGVGWCAEEAGRASLPTHCEQISLSMPQGHWRIHVARDGSGHMSFGALPYFARFPAGTLDHGQVCSELLPKLSPQNSGVSAVAGPVGMVAVEKTGALWVFLDTALALRLFETGWSRREPPRDEEDRQGYKVLEEFWQRDPVFSLPGK